MKREIIGVALAATIAAYGVAGPAFSGFAATAPSHYSYVDLVNMITDMERNTLIPQSGEKSGEASSYDRNSRYDSATNKYVNWGSNADFDGNYGEVNDDRGHGLVTLNLTGPGCIFRSWSADAKDGKIDIYIDGKLLNFDSTGSFVNFFKPTGLFAGLDELCYTTSGNGRNNYVPISFNNSCKIIFRDGWGAFYQFNYTTFPEGTTVEPMPEQFSTEQKAALVGVNYFFKNKIGTNPAGELVGETKSFAMAEGGKSTVYEASRNRCDLSV